MNVRKPETEADPGYPSLRHLGGAARRLGLAAFGAGAVVAGVAAEAPPARLGGVPAAPRSESASAVQEATPVLPGSVRTAPEASRLGGKPAVVPHDGTGAKDAVGKAYVVRDGDTLSGIARQKLGDASLWPEIAKLNPGIDPERLKVGTRIVLPDTVTCKK